MATFRAVFLASTLGLPLCYYIIARLDALNLADSDSILLFFLAAAVSSTAQICTVGALVCRFYTY
ncbi:hypothetical protein DSUL_30034 [Desulfovibrionales bacterium]